MKNIFIALFTSALVLFTGCTNIDPPKITPPIEVENVSQGILAAVLLFGTVGQTLEGAESANIINSTDAEKARNALDDADNGILAAIGLYSVGKELEAEQELNAARAVLLSTQAILTALKSNLENIDEQ